MNIQTIRRTNLHAVIRQLEQDGHTSRDAQAIYLGRPVTPRKLQAMLDGAHIDVLFAEHLEYVLFKPKGWFSRLQEAVRDNAAPAEAVSG